MFLSSFCTRKANKLFSNNGTFTEAMIQAFLCYVLSVYPRGIKICKLMDPLAQYIIKGWPFNDYWPDSGTLETRFVYANRRKGKEWVQRELGLSRSYS